MRYEFGDFVLDTDLGHLLHRGESVSLRPRPYRLLVFFIENRHRQLSGEEILAGVWPEAVVSQSAFSSALRDLRRALGETGAHEGVIRTERGRGYRFVADVREDRAGGPEREPLIGRRTERAALGRALDECLAGRGRTVLLSGEPGIGKSRLAAEIAALAIDRGARAPAAWCPRDPDVPPFWLWGEVVHPLIEEWPDLLESPETRAVGRLLLERSEVRGGQGSSLRFELLDALRRLVMAASERRPLVLVLEDLHWADGSSLAALRRLAHAAPRARVLIIGTYRDTALSGDHPLDQLLADLAPSDACLSLSLGGLTREETDELIAATADRALGAEEREAIWRRSGGNPFFVRELVANALSRGPQEASQEVPVAVRSVLRQHVRGLSPRCREVLEIAGLLGERFELELLREVAELSASGLAGVLEEARRRSIVANGRATPRVRFRHALVRDALLADLDAERRRQIHAGITRALERRTGRDAEAHAAALALHAERAVPLVAPERALEHMARAADVAFRGLGFDESAALYRAALALAERWPDRTAGDEGRLWLRLGEVHYAAGDIEESVSALRTACRQLDHSGTPEDRARAAVRLALALWQAPALPAAEPDPKVLLERALEANGGLGAELTAQVKIGLARCQLGRSSERARALVEEALSLAPFDDPATLVSALDVQRLTHSDPGDVARRLELSTRMGQIAGEAELAMETNLALEARFADLLCGGDTVAALSVLREIEALEARLRSPYYSTMLRHLQLTLALLQGRFEDVEQELAAIGRESEVGEGTIFTPLLATQLFVLRYHQGRAGELATATREMVRLEPYRAEWRVALPLVLLGQGDIAGAAHELRCLAGDSFADLGDGRARLSSLAVAAEACGLLGDAEHAEVLIDQLTPSAGEVVLAGHHVVLGPVDRHLARLCALTGSFGEAEGHFERARRTLERMDARPFLTHLDAEEAAMRLRRRASDDRERAADLLARAGEAARALGMRGVARDCDELAATAGKVVPLRPTG